MAYITNYSLTVKTSKPRLFSIKKRIATGFLIIAFILCVCFPAAVRKVRSVLFPFLEPNVQSAFSEMLEDVKKGELFSDAATVFCREIIYSEEN